MSVDNDNDAVTASKVQLDASYPPDDGSWDVGPPTVEWYQKTEVDELRPDYAVPITEFFQGGPSGGTIAHAEGATSTWQINFSLQVNIPIADAFFSAINATVGGQYSQAFTDTNTYTETIPANQTARIIYVPMMHHTSGLGKITQGWAEVYDGVVGGYGDRVVGGDPNAINVFFPIPGGQYQLQFR